MRDEASFHIRPATSDDVEALIAVAAGQPYAPQWSHLQYREVFGTTPGRQRWSLVIEKDDRILGFLIAAQVESEWELESIVVDAGRGRKGLGTRLIEALIRHVSKSGGGSIALEVRAGNSAARGLYEKCGFSIAGKRKAYYSGPLEDAVIYRTTAPPVVSQ